MNEQIKPPSIREVIRTLNIADDKDVNFIIAAGFNLYIEATKRLHGRVLLTPSDIETMFAMVDTLMTERVHGLVEPAARSSKLSEEEENKLLNAVEASATAKRRT